MDRGSMLHAIAFAVVLQLSNAADVPAPILDKARAEVVRVYRDIGVDVEWSASGEVVGHQHIVHVIVVPNETGELQRRAETVMGAAIRTPRGTQVAYVFYRRVRDEAARYAVSPAFVLACAIAHEIGQRSEGRR